MTLMMSFHAGGGAVGGPHFYEADETSIAGGVTPLTEKAFIDRVGTSNLLFAIHGFNVNSTDGARGAVRLDKLLAMPPGTCFVGVLWPGDYWLPAVNYPFEGSTANDCGKRLATFCNTALKAAGRISILSHSLGARLALTAAGLIDKKLGCICLTAAAVNNDSLENEFERARRNSSAIANLASRGDMVLKWSFPAGDLFADIFTDGPDSLAGALGRFGPRVALSEVDPTAVAKRDLKIGHSNYFPPFEMPTKPEDQEKFAGTIGFMRRALLGESQVWPPA